MVNAWASFRIRDFRYYLASLFLSLTAHQMMAVAVGQYVYERTHSPLHLGYIGLALFLPRFGLGLFAGHAADRFERCHVILVCRFVYFLAVALAAAAFYTGAMSLPLLYSLLFLMGIANAFDGPARQAFITNLVPHDLFQNAVTWNVSSMQIAFIVGPALGGILYAMQGKAAFVMGIVAALRLIGVLLIGRIHTRTGRHDTSEMSWKTLLAGIHYVFRKQIILGSISLDLFAVLLGGAVALMPAFANDILRVGPTGLGILRAAPSAGAALMALFIAHHPPFKRPGSTMLWCVALFGLATVVFGLSHSFLLSIACLVLLGAADMVSVVIRGVLVQVETPPEMRGRVSAVNLVFIGASNELGEFESGLTAAWWGVVPATVIGGLGTLAVVGIWAWRFPEIRTYAGNKTPSTDPARS